MVQNEKYNFISTFIMLSNEKNNIIMGVRLILSFACCPMERPTCSFLAQDFVSCIIGLMNLKMKNILQQFFLNLVFMKC